MSKGAKTKNRRRSSLLRLLMLVSLLLASAVACLLLTFSETATQPGWRTYRSDNLPFTFDYPEEWQLKEQLTGKEVIIVATERQNGLRTDMLTLNYGTSRVSFGGTLCELNASKECIYVENKSYVSGYIYDQHKKRHRSWLGKEGRQVITISVNQYDKVSNKTLSEIVRSFKGK